MTGSVRIEIARLSAAAIQAGARREDYLGLCRLAKPSFFVSRARHTRACRDQSSTRHALPYTQVTKIIDATWEYEVAESSATPIKSCFQTLARFGYDIELLRAAGLLLNDRCAIPKRACAHQVTYPDFGQVVRSLLLIARSNSALSRRRLCSSR